MNVSLEGQAIAVTGGTSKLGRAIALECAAAGADVLITFHSNGDANQILDDLQNLVPDGKFVAASLDVRDARNIQAFCDEAFRLFPNLSGLVNNAAIFNRTPFENLDEDDFDEHIAVNLKGPFLLSRIFGSEFLKRDGGSIVNMADIYGIRPLGNYVPYSVSKAGVVMLTLSMARALAPHVRVNCICPGTILPPSQGADESGDEAALLKRIPFGRFGRAEEIAQTAVFLLGGPAFITGAILPVDGGQSLR